MSHDSTNLSFKNNDGKPRLFSLNNHRPLESKRTNVYLDPSSNKTPQAAQKAPNLLLTSLLSNPPSTMTPNRPRLSDMSYRPNSSTPKDFPHERISLTEHAYNRPKLSLLTPRSTEIKFSHEKLDVTQDREHISSARSTHSPSISTNDEHGQQYTYPEVIVSRDQQLKEEKEKLLVLYIQESRNLDNCRVRLDEVLTQSKENALELKQIRPALTLARETLAGKEAELSSISAAFSETKSALSDLRHKYAALTETLNKETAERQRLEAGTAHLKAGMGQMSALHSELGEAFKELKKNQNTSTNQFQEFVAELAETKRLARNGLAALQPLLNDEDALARTAHTKETLKELSDTLSSSQQVTDILRDKLFSMSSELCNAQYRIKELEDEKRGELKQLLAIKQEEQAQFRSFVAVEGNLTELSAKVSIRERETIDSVARAAVFETELESTRSQLQSSEMLREKLSSELEALRIEKDGNMTTILALQNVISAGDKDLISLKTEVKALTESKAELRALLAESKKDLSQKMQELGSKRDPNPDLVEKIRELETNNAILQRDLLESKNKNLSMFLSDNQIREKLHQADKAKNETLSRVLTLEEEMRRESKNTHDRKESQELKERLDVQSVHLFQSKEECTGLKERLNAALDKLSMTKSALDKAENSAALMNKLQEQRAVDSEATINDLRVRLENTIAELEAVKLKLEESEANLNSANEAAAHANQVNTYQSSEQAKMDRVLITNLERKNAELVEASATIIARYNSGLLTESEKKFVGYLMDEVDRIHAEGVAKKDNELRRRLITVDDLKAKNAELQTALARLLKEKETQPGALNKSIVGLRNWVSSSPVQNEDQQSLTATSDPHLPAPTSDRMQPVQPSEPGKDKGLDSSYFHDNVDSDDDSPLSELSLVGEDTIGEESGTGNKRNRPQSPSAVDEPKQTKKRTKMAPNPPQKDPLALSPVSKKKTSETTHTAKTRQRKRK